MLAQTVSFGDVKRSTRLVVLVLGSIAYWLAAAMFVVLAGVALPGDCGIERTSAGVAECLGEVRIIVLMGLAVAALLYGFLLRRFARTL
jgi:hypothetical protein